jgi:hypothetical protein
MHQNDSILAASLKEKRGPSLLVNFKDYSSPGFQGIETGMGQQQNLLAMCILTAEILSCLLIGKQWGVLPSIKMPICQILLNILPPPRLPVRS